jgi:hypothetical protein
VSRATAPRPPQPPRVIYAYRPSFHPWYYDPWYPGFGVGIGYSYYAPWSWYGPGWYPHYGGRYPDDYGRVRMKVEPKDAEVYVDGYYAGTVDDFDGTFQGLRLEPGGYHIEVRRDGNDPLTFDVRVQPDRTLTLRGEMKPVP